MTKFDLNEERQRLARWYRAMGEEELREIAKQEGSLTDVAREVVRAEMLRRRLKVDQLTESPAGDGGMKPAKIRDFMFLPDALVAKSILDSAGIESFLADETTMRMGLWSTLIGGVKLWVRQEDAETATALLKQDFSKENGVEGVEE
jgi:hypothetical protein